MMLGGTSRPFLGVLAALALAGCPNTVVFVVLAMGDLPETTVVVDELAVISVTATVPADALPAELEEGWWGELEVWVSGWEETDEVWLSLTDCGSALYDSYDVTELPEMASMSLMADLFEHCPPQQDCARTICIELERVQDGEPLELGWSVQAKVHDRKRYRGASRSGQRELEEHPVPQPLVIAMDAEVL